MNYLLILFLVVVPISIFLSGFLAARQLRAVANVPVISMIFVQRKLFFSVVIGFFASLLFTTILLLVTKSSMQLFIIFIGLFLLATFGFYYGVALGWGRASSVSENITPANQILADTPPQNFIVENSFNSVKLTINTKKRWVWFAMSLFRWVAMGLCILPIAGLVLISILQNYLAQNMNFLVWLLVGGIVLYLLYIKFQEALEYVFDKEIIEVDNLSVRIEKSEWVSNGEKNTQQRT